MQKGQNGGLRVRGSPAPRQPARAPAPPLERQPRRPRKGSPPAPARLATVGAAAPDIGQGIAQRLPAAVLYTPYKRRE